MATSYGAKPQGHIARAGTVVSAKRWSGNTEGGQNAPKGRIINVITQLVDDHTSMTPSDLLTACTSLNTVRATRRKGSFQPEADVAIAKACAPLKEFVLRECDKRLITVIAPLCASLSHWMPQFSYDTLPGVCDRLVGKLQKLGSAQVFSLLEVLPHSSATSIRLCNEAAELVLPRCQLLTPKRMASCLSLLSFGTDPAVFKLIQFCADALSPDDLGRMSLHQLLACTRASYCKQVKLDQFAGSLCAEIVKRPDLAAMAAQLEVACFQLATNGYSLPADMMEQYRNCLPGDFGGNTQRLWQALLVLDSVRSADGLTDADLWVEHSVAVALLSQFATIPASYLLPLLRVAKRSQAYSSCLPELVVRLCKAPAELESMSYAELQFLLSAAKTLKVLSAEPVFVGIFSAVSFKVKDLSQDDVSHLVQCLLGISAAKGGSDTMVTMQLESVVGTLVEDLSSSRSDSVYTLVELQDFVKLMVSTGFRPIVSQLRALFLPKMASGSPAEVVSCLRSIYSAFGAEHAEIISMGIVSQERESLEQLSNADLLWIVNFLGECPRGKIHFGAGHQRLLDLLESLVSDGQLSAGELCSLGGLAALEQQSDHLLRAVTKNLHEQLQSLSTRQMGQLHAMAVSMVSYNAEIINDVKLLLSKRTALSALDELLSLIPMCRTSVHRDRLADLLAAVSKREFMDEQPLQRIAAVLPTLYQHRLLGSGTDLARNLCDELKERYLGLPYGDCPSEYSWLLYCVSMLTTVPVELLEPFHPDKIYRMHADQVVHLLCCYASIGHVSDTIRGALAYQLLRGWLKVENPLRGQRGRCLAKLDFLNSTELMGKAIVSTKGDTRGGNLLRTMRCHNVSLLSKCVSSLNFATPTSAALWTNLLHSVLLHCSEVRYSPEHWQAVQALSTTDIGENVLPIMLLATGEWVRMCQTGELGMADAYWDVLKLAAPAELLLEEAGATQSRPECPEIAMLLNGVGRLQGRADCLHPDSALLLCPLRRRNASTAYTRHYSHCCDSPDTELGGNWSLRSHIAHCLTHSGALSTRGSPLSTSPPSSSAASTTTAAVTSCSPVHTADDDSADRHSRCSNAEESADRHSRCSGAEESADRHSRCSDAEDANSEYFAQVQSDTSNTVADADDLPFDANCKNSTLPLLSTLGDELLFKHLSGHANPSQFIHGPVVDRDSGILIDGAVALGEDGAMLPFPSKRSPDSNLLPWGPPDWPEGTCQRLAFCVLRPEHGVRFSNDTRCDVRLKMSILKQYGWTVQTVDSSTLTASNTAHAARSILRQVSVNWRYSRNGETSL